MGPIAQGAILLVAVGLIGVNGVQGPETPQTYADNPLILRLWMNPIEYNMIGVALSRGYVLVPGWTPYAIDQYSKIYSGDLDGGNPTAHRMAAVYEAGFIGVAKLCPPMRTYTAMNFNAGDFFDYASNTTGDMFYIKTDVTLASVTADVLTDEDCIIDAEADESDIEYYPEMETCTAFTSETCTIFFDTVNYYFFTAPTLFINGQVEGFLDSMLCWDDGNYGSTLMFSKIAYFRQDVIDMVDEIDNLDE